MAVRRISQAQARRFVLLRQGLLGDYRYYGAQGVIDFTLSAGCVQYDPVDVCGRSPELTYLSRVGDYQSAQLVQSLYQRRELIEYFDKNLCILPARDWPCFARTRAWHAQPERRSHELVEAVAPQVRAFLAEHGPAFSEELPDLGHADWYWNRTTAARAAMEALYFRGELAVHHREGARRCFDFARNLLPEPLLAAPDPYPELSAHQAFLLQRRIGAVGLLWNRRSDAHLCIPDFTAANRQRAYDTLLAAGRILPVQVEGLRDTFYLQSADAPLLDKCLDASLTPRTELIAPLDSFLWDRRLIEALFGFAYRWEIYTPAKKRQYGYYVLPVLQGDTLCARAECVRDRAENALVLRNLWIEPGAKLDRRALRRALRRLAGLNGLSRVTLQP